MPSTDNRIYYEDQAAWQVDDWYSLWRYLNRLFINPRGLKTGEIEALDLNRVSEDTRYLLKHMLIRTKRYERMLAEHPHLRALENVGPIDHDIVLSADPTLAYDYYTENRIFL